MFVKKFVNINDSFVRLSHDVNAEVLGKGRKGAVLATINNKIVPIIRTTTSYKNPIQNFTDNHIELICKIKTLFPDYNIDFNNALFEIYDNYFTMGYHSDQALDLSNDSYICLFSCYENSTTKQFRKLKVQNKNTKQYYDIILENNSVVLFSTDVNKNHLHKIILEADKSQTKWLGITFRLSKTYIDYSSGHPLFLNGTKLLLANEEEKSQFYKLRSMENKSVDFEYPKTVNYTISESDLMFPLHHKYISNNITK